MIISYFKHYFIFFNVNKHLADLLNWHEEGAMWAISVSFVYTGLPVWAFPHSHKVNLTYCLKSPQLLAFAFHLFV